MNLTIPGLRWNIGFKEERKGTPGQGGWSEKSGTGMLYDKFYNFEVVFVVQNHRFIFVLSILFQRHHQHRIWCDESANVSQ